VTYFNTAEKASVQRSFLEAEGLARNYFLLPPDAWKVHRYEVRTLEQLAPHEKSDEAFAHLCKYGVRKGSADAGDADVHFFRVCLQDHRILDAVKRGGSFIRFAPLMLYIATHELVHIVRFNLGQSAFDMGQEDRKREEDRVHAITRRMLKTRADPHLDLVLDCFGNDYRIGDLAP